MMAPAGLTYSSLNPAYVRSLAITANTPSSTGGAIDSYAVAPALPAGLTLSTTTGIITGTPTALSPVANFVVTATNAVGSTPVTLGISVVDRPTLSFTGAIGTTGAVGVTMTVTPTTLASNGSPVTQCGIKPASAALPAGLTVNATTCEISGTPTAVTASAVYALIATNAAGDSADAPVTLAITAAPATLTISDATTYAFGSWATGAIAEHVFSVTNSGTGTATGITSGAIGAGFAFKGGSFPGLGGNCTTSLVPSATCVFVVTFSPSSVANFAGTITINYSDLVQARSATRAVSGAGTALASLAVTDYRPQVYIDFGLPADAATFDFGQLGLGGTLEHTFWLTNNGGGTATLTGGGTLALPFAYKGPLPGAGGTCATTLAPGESCSVIITFSPTAATTSTATFTGNYTGGVTATVTRNLSGRGTSGPAVTVYDYGIDSGGVSFGAAFDFGTVGLGANSEHTFLVVNVGDATATTLGAGAVNGPFTFPGGFPGGTAGAPAQELGNLPYCGSTLAAGSACAVKARFTPTSAVATTGSINVSFSGQTASRATRGTGTQLALLTIREAVGSSGPTLVFDFGLRAAPSVTAQGFLLSNVGAQTATALTGAALPAGFVYTGGAFPGGAGRITTSNGASYDFCTAGGSLTAGSVCVISVEFRPSASGTYAGTVAISYGNGAGTVSVSRSIKGEGSTQAIVTIATCLGCGNGGSGDPQLDLGPNPVSTTRTGVGLLTNSGLASTTLTSGGLTGSAFSYQGGFPGGTGTTNINGTDYPLCGPAPYTLAAGATCAVRVLYTAPSTSGTQTGRLTINTSPAARPSVSMDLTASSTNLAIVFLEPVNGGGNNGGGTPTQDFGYVPTGATRSTFFRLSNIGAVPATVTNASLTGTGYTYTGGTYPGGTAGGTVNVNGSSYTFCAATPGGLPAGRDCVVQVSYTASGTLPQNGALTLTLTGALQSTLAYNLRATPTTLAIVSLSSNPNGGGGGCCGAPGYNFGTVPSPSSSTAFFFVSNSGTSSATVTEGGLTGSAFSYSGASYPGGTAGSSVNVYGSNYNYCPASGGTLAAGATCVIQVRYSATGTLQQTGAMNLTLVGATDTRLTMNLSGTPTTSAIISINSCANCGSGGGSGSPTFDFGVVPSPSTRSQFFFLTNSGTGTAQIAPGGLSGLGMGFTGGSYPGGTAGSAVTIQSATYNYCPVSGGNLVGGATCVIQITWNATGTSPVSGSLSVNLQGATTPNVGSFLAGTPTTQAIVNIATCLNCGSGPGGFFDFGTSGAPINVALLVQNTGLATAGLTDGAGLSAPFSWTTGSYPGGAGSTVVGGTATSFCGTTLAAGASCALSVRYSGASTSTNGSVALNLTGAFTSRASLGLSGTTTTRAFLTISENDGFFGCTDAACGNPMQFPNVSVPGPVANDFLITNRGAQTATSIAVGTSLSAAFGFGVTGTGVYPGGTGSKTFNGGGASYPYCGATLAAGAQCLVTLNFHPAAAGTRYTSALNLQFSDSGGAVAPNANRNISGNSN